MRNSAQAEKLNDREAKEREKKLILYMYIYKQLYIHICA